MMWTVWVFNPIDAIGVNDYVFVPGECAPNRTGCHCAELFVDAV